MSFFDLLKMVGGLALFLYEMCIRDSPGATYNGRKESEDALALTLAVGSILEENGVDVYYTRTTDIRPNQWFLLRTPPPIQCFLSLLSHMSTSRRRQEKRTPRA